MSYTIHQVDFNGMDVSTEALIEMLRGYVEDKDLTNITTQITQILEAMNNKANSGHKHGQSDIDNLSQSLAGKLDVGQHPYADIISNPNAISQLDNVNIDNLSINSKYSIYVDNNEQIIIKKGNSEIAHYNMTTSKWVFAFDISQHTHTTSDITDLSTNYAASSHSHTTSDITDLDLSNYASSSHTHTTINNSMTITAPSTDSGNILTLYGNYKFSRFNVAKDTLNEMAVFGYNCENSSDTCAYIKVYGKSCELEVHSDRVKVIGNLEITGTINGQNWTITHRAPIQESIENYIIGRPVFNAGVIAGKNGEITPIDCIPYVKTNGTYREYLGIIVKINANTIDFATHGDYLFHVNNSSNYHIGDILTYDGNIIADDTFINSKILTSIVGKVMGIIDEHTVAVFKQ